MENAAPPGADCVQLYSGGAEAVESALRLAQEATGRKRIAHFQGSFHGKTRGVLGLMGSDWKKPWGPYGDLAPVTLPYADCDRCPYRLEPRSCGLACAQEAAQRIQESASDLAAVIIEPIQGTAGNIIPPLGFLNEIQKATRDAGALFIADEMITGFGRTGRFWGVEPSRIYPDITTAGKGMAAGYPISAVFTRKSLCVRAPSWSAPSGSSSSFGANSLACAAALATLEVILEHNYVHQSRVRGFELLDGLQQLARRYPTAIRAVRGQGLLLGVDLDDACVRDGKLFQNALQEGLFTMAYTSRLRIQPPLVISSEEIAESLNRFERALIATLP
jgi:4-aminobutyrate aminotransferase-like enzyme